MTTHDDAKERSSDAVAQYFAERGVSANAQSKGLRGIIAQWDAIARTAARYDLTLDDWLNDVDLRDIIAGALGVAPEHELHSTRDALDRADEAFRTATVETNRSLWGDTVGTADKHDPQQQWWYFRRPAHPGEIMREELTKAGIS